MDIQTDRMSWTEICHSDAFRGRWVALADWEVDSATGQAKEGAVVDVDDNLVDLCERLRASEKTNCQIVYCRESSENPLDENSDSIAP